MQLFCTRLIRAFQLCILLCVFVSPLFAQQQIILRGRVTDQTGKPISGASIYTARNTVKTNTDAAGYFILTAVDIGGLTLYISHQGFQPVSKKIEPPYTNTLNIVLNSALVELNEVVVTTQKRDQRSLEVPIALSALSGRQLEKLNIRQFDELSDLVPGLQMQLQSPNNPGYVIRGITSDNGDSRAQPRVSVFQDGVSISRSRASAVELFDLERVEVAKGPQGTLFGRGAEIGAVHLIQNKAQEQFSSFLGLGYGDYHQRFATGHVNVPIQAEQLFNRTAFYYEARDGFNRNLSGGRLNGKGVIAVRNSTRLNFGERTTADLILNYQYDDYPGTSFKSNRFAPAGGDTDPNTFADLEQGENLYIHRHVGGATLLVDHSLSNRWKLASISGFRAFKSDENFDADGTPAPILFVGEVAQGNQYSQEFRFNYTGNERFSGFMGASYFYENSLQRVPMYINEQYLYPAYIAPILKQQVVGALPALASGLGLPEEQVNALTAQVSQLFTPPPPVQNGVAQPVENLPNLQPIALNLINALMGGALPPNLTWDQLLQSGMLPPGVLPDQMIGLVSFLNGGSISPSHYEEYTNYGRNQAVELFGDGTYNLTEKLRFTAGLRGSYEHQRGGYYSPSPQQPSVFGGIANNGSPTLLNPVSDEKIYASKSYWSYVGRVVFQYLTEETNLYLSVSRGRRPGVIRIVPQDTTFLKPEIVMSYEAGIKRTAFRERLHYDVSVYYYDWTNFQTISLQQVPGTINPQWVADDGGKAHSIGAETSLGYQVTDWMNVFGNYAFIDAKYAGTDQNGNQQEYADHRLRLTPKHSFALGLDADIPLKTSGSIYLRPTYAYKSGVYFEDNNRPDLYQAGYGLMNFAAGYQFQLGSTRYEIGCYGKNIFDTKYMIDAGNSGDNIGYPTFIAGSRSLIGLQASVRF